jgi:hypothetical protein
VRPGVRLVRVVATGAAAVVVGTAAFGGAYRRRMRSRLFDLALDREIAEVRLRLHDSAVTKRRHDLVNAFTAVEGAALSLSRESLSASDRSSFTDVLRLGLQGLRVLILEGPGHDEVVLADVGASIAAEPAWRGRMLVDVAPDLKAPGSPGEIGEAIRLVLTYLSRASVSNVVTVRGSRNNNRTELRFDDDVHHVSPRDRRRVGEPERRPTFGLDPVRAFDIAVRLVREQGGDVAVERRRDGVSLVVSWPGPVV